MRQRQRIARLERQRGRVRAMTAERRAALLALVIAKAENALAGGTMPAADWRGVDAATIAHRAALLKGLNHARGDN